MVMDAMCTDRPEGRGLRPWGQLVTAQDSWQRATAGEGRQHSGGTAKRQRHQLGVQNSGSCLVEAWCAHLE